MIDTITALVIFLLPLAYSPGPGNLFFAAIGARGGLAASVPASAGYHVATWVVTFAMGYGLARVLTDFPAVFDAMQVAGAIYMFWLAWVFLRAGASDGTMPARTASFVDGVVLLVLNPKAYVIITLMFTQFLSADGVDFVTQLLVITTVFTLNNLIAFIFWTLIGDGLARIFRTEREARLMNVAFGVMLIAVAVWMMMR